MNEIIKNEAGNVFCISYKRSLEIFKRFDLFTIDDKTSGEIGQPDRVFSSAGVIPTMASNDMVNY